MLTLGGLVEAFDSVMNDSGAVGGASEDDESASMVV